ncbi:MAG TPA: TonB family protein, partial [Bacteroidota bacterium]
MKRFACSLAFITTMTAPAFSQIAALEQPSSADTTYYFAVQQLPEPIGGIAAIQNNVVYPETAKRDSIEGTVFVDTYIDEDGNVERTAVVRGVRSDLDVAAQNAVRAVKF